MKDEKDDIFMELKAAIAMLRSHYLSTNNKQVSDVEMMRHGLSAMMSTLGDPFTNYVPPVQLTNYRSKKVQTVVGVGLIADFDRQGKARVIAALEGSPTDVPEIPSGAEILRINGKDIRKTDVKRLNNLLNGPEGTRVSIDLVLESGELRDLEITRKPVEVEHIRFHRIADTMTLVRIAWFSGTCHTGFIESLKASVEQGVKGIILDLRANSGGSIIATRTIFSAICNQEVMYYSRKSGDEDIKDRVLGEYLFDLAVVVIADFSTFSAGEVLAGALQDHGVAAVVGMQSGGKGSMQQVFPLEGQIAGAMRITTATNCTPNGHIMQGRGITPDFPVELEFPELFVDDGAQNYRTEGRNYLKQLRADRLKELHGQERIDQILTGGDKQLIKAVEVLKARIEEKSDTRSDPTTVTDRAL